MKKPAASIAALALSMSACGGNGSSNDPINGSHVITDGVGDTKDAQNALGKKPENPLGAADILGIRMDGDGTRLRIRIAIGQFPLDRLPNDAKKGPAYFLNVWPDRKKGGAPSYVIAVVREDVTPRRVGDRAEGWRLSVCKGQDVCTQPAPGSELAIVGKEVRLDIPLSLLKGVRNPFSWSALSYWNDTLDPLKAWSDWLPDNARPRGGPDSYSEPGTRAIFPPPKKR